MGNDISKKVEAGKGDALYSEILIKGTKFSIREILRQLSQGKSIDEILKANPNMTMSDIEVCFEYACELVGALDLKKAMTAVNRVISKRQAFIDKIEEMRKNPPDIFL